MRFKDQKIYLWRTEELVSELALGHVSELQKAIYLGADFILVLCLFYIFTPPSPNSTLVMYAEGVVVLATTVLGILVSFRKNGAGKGKHFVEYFVCLTLPLFVRVNIIVWSTYGIIFHITGAFLGDVPVQYHAAVDLLDDLVTSLSIVVASVAFFVLMANRIGRIRAFVERKQSG